MVLLTAYRRQDYSRKTKLNSRAEESARSGFCDLIAAAISLKIRNRNRKES